MKHNLEITVFLITLFLASQVTGLFIVDKYIDKKATAETGTVTYKNLPYSIERPVVEPSTSFIFIFIAILIGTGLLLLLVKFRSVGIWKFWFLLSVLITLSIALYAFIQQFTPQAIAQFIAFGIALPLSIIKIFRPNILVHNLTEILVYGGLAAIFVPIMNVFAVVVLLILISIYDAIAVWQSKHMIKLAKFQAGTNVFAGLFIPYKSASPVSSSVKAGVAIKAAKSKEEKGARLKLRNAVLGGGDMGFPLIFAGVVMKDAGFLKALIIPVFAAIALGLLLFFSKKDRFYPAMPFITAGCFIGYGVILLLPF